MHFVRDSIAARSADRPLDDAAASPAPISSDELKRRVQWGGFWVIAGRTSGIGLTVALNVLLARFVLDKPDYGAFVLISSIISLAATFAMLGLNGAIVPLISRNLALGKRAAVRRMLRLTAAAALVCGLVVALVTPWALKLLSFELPQAALLPWLVAGCALLLAWQQIGAEALRGFHEQQWANVLSGGQVGGPLTLLLLVGMIGATLAWERPNLVTLTIILLIALCCTVLGTAACLIRVVGTHVGGRQKSGDHQLPKLGEVLHLCVPLLLIQLLVFIAAQADVWIAGYYVSGSDLAVYAAARRLMLLTAIPLQIAAATVAPSIAELHAHRRISELKSMVRAAATAASLPAIVALVAVAIAGGAILRLVFGPGYEAGYSVVVILGVGQLIFNWCGVCGTALTMTGHQNVALAATGATSAILVLAGPPLTARFGIHGLACASALGLAVQNLTIWILARRYLDIWTHASFRWSEATWMQLIRRAGGAIDRADGAIDHVSDAPPPASPWLEKCEQCSEL